MPKNQWVGPVDQELAWKEGFLGTLVRYRGLLGFALFDAGGASALWKLVTLRVALDFAGVATTVLVGLCWYRGHRERTYSTWARIHTLCHSIRDASAELQGHLQKGAWERYEEGIKHFHPRVANQIAAFFRELTGDASVNCAIRLANSEVQRRTVYLTRGRSDEMERDREKKTQGIGKHEGIAKYLFEENNSRGVVLIVSIEKAIMKGWWKRCPTDEFKDVQKLMVAPMNGFLSGDFSMLGILYVTSKDRPFRLAHVPPMKAVADLLGMVYPAIIAEPIGDGAILDRSTQ